MLERLYTLACVVISVMIFQASAHGQTLPPQDLAPIDQIARVDFSNNRDG